jgi:hypothetical protein
MLAIASSRFPYVRQSRIRAMLVDKSSETDAAVALAAVASDVEPVEFADKLAERD